MSATPPRDTDLERLLGPEGPVAGELAISGGHYEERPQQIEMARAVAGALSSGRHLIAEAGTGVGKSFAYLVPLLQWAEASDGRAAVATSTIALQEQLVRRDLPLLAAALPFEVPFALVKGRGNYVCLRRLAMTAVREAPLIELDDKRGQIERIRRWAATTREGSRQDLPFRPAPAVWSAVQAERGNCQGRSCPQYVRCHYQRSRRRAFGARCLVLNHHLLMSDLALRRSGVSFLPEAAALVLDEAHDLEDTAAEHLGLRASSLGMSMLLSRLWHSKRESGLLSRGEWPALQRRVDAARAAAGAFFDALGDWAAEPGEAAGTARIQGDFPVADALSARLRELAAGVADRAPAVSDEDLSLELTARAHGLDAAADTIEGIVTAREGDVRWVETDGRGRTALVSAPVDVATLLGEVLWDEHDAVVLTSATLGTGRPPSFAFLRARLGVPEPTTDEISVGSPFDYEEQVTLILREDLPDPVRDPAGYQAALPAAVLESVRRSRGGCFVLFTGYGSMRATADAVRAEVEAEGLTLLVQGEALERASLLERFREGNAVLMGVASFWQGVDVPGDALRHVVIARLPFDVPTHPLQQARQERVEEAGKSAFARLSLPTAALRLKQGFGRLIRSAADKGVVTILDPRIVTRSYGRVLLRSLPECRRE